MRFAIRKGLLVMLLMASVDASAFDGRHNGFTMGIGAGTHVTEYSTILAGLKFPANSRTGFALDLRPGWTFFDQMMVELDFRTVWFEVGDQLNQNITYGLGLTWLLPEGKPRFNFGGVIGNSIWEQSTAPNQTWRGPGFGMHVGYEIVRHLNLELGIAFGTPAAYFDNVKYETEITSLRLTIGWLGY